METTKKNIVLVGMMGAGKSKTARILVDMLEEYSLVEADALIEEQEKMPITEIFAQFGESYFRQKENELVKKLATLSKQVISTGGGMYVNDENKELLRKSGFVVYLETSPKVVYERVKNDTSRPLLKTQDDLLEKITTILSNRGNHYKQADFIINTDNKSCEEVAQAILKEYENYGNE